MNKRILFSFFGMISLIPASAFAVPALSISVPKPMGVTYKKATNTVIPQTSDNIGINIALAAGNCTAAEVTGLMLGKAKDKNTTNYPVKKPCDKKADFTHTLEVSPMDLLPESAVRNIAPSCRGRGATGGLVSIPMEAELYGNPKTTIAKATVNIPFQVTCE